MQMPTKPHNTVVWIHADNLSPFNPALTRYPDVPALFVWDDELLAQWRISLKRIVFIYECLLELPVVIRRGHVSTEVTQFALEQGAGRIITSESPSPRFRWLCRSISQAMPSGTRLEVLSERPFVAFDGDIDLKRFSRYWRTVKSYAMIPEESD